MNKRLLGNCATIRDRSGRCWAVRVDWREDGFHFQNGWQDFVKYHCLKAGDFVVFDYDGGSHFTATIYGSNTCEKGEGLAKKNSLTPVSLAEKGNQLLQPKVEVDEVKPQIYEENCKMKVINSKNVPCEL